MKEQIDEALAELGGEPLAGSGFEAETDDTRFRGAVLLPSTLLRRRSEVSEIPVTE